MNDAKLLDFYRKKVSEIPDMRYCLEYPEEIAVKCLEHLIANHTKEETDSELVYSCMSMLKGIANPAVVNTIINEWKNNERED